MEAFQARRCVWERNSLFRELWDVSHFHAHKPYYRKGKPKSIKGTFYDSMPLLLWFVVSSVLSSDLGLAEKVKAGGVALEIDQSNGRVPWWFVMSLMANAYLFSGDGFKCVSIYCQDVTDWK